MQRPEYWVMRVFRHNGAPVLLSHMTPATKVVVLAAVNTGGLALLPPDSRVAAPVEVFDDEMEAHVFRERCQRDSRGAHEFRVILNVDITGAG